MLGSSRLQLTRESEVGPEADMRHGHLHLQLEGARLALPDHAHALVALGAPELLHTDASPHVQGHVGRQRRLALGHLVREIDQGGARGKRVVRDGRVRRAPRAAPQAPARGAGVLSRPYGRVRPREPEASGCCHRPLAAHSPPTPAAACALPRPATAPPPRPTAPPPPHRPTAPAAPHHSMRISPSGCRRPASTSASSVVAAL